MNKGLQIFLLILLFLVCCAGGYFVGDILFSQPEATATAKVVTVTEAVKPIAEPEPVVEEPEGIPVIVATPTPVWNSNKKRYSVTIEAKVDTDDYLRYEILDIDSLEPIVEGNFEGKFDGIAPSESGKYIVVVTNVGKKQSTEQLVDGFVKVEAPKPTITPLTAAELTQAINNTDDGLVPSHIASKFGSRQKVVVLSGSGANDPSDFSTIWTDRFNLGHRYEVVKAISDPTTGKLVEVHINIIK
jgi:hypothetical protein